MGFIIIITKRNQSPSILVYKVTHTAKKYELFKPVDLVVNKLILFPTAKMHGGGSGKAGPCM